MTTKFVAGYDAVSRPFDELQHRALAQIFGGIDRLVDEADKAQLALEIVELLPAERQREIAALIGAV